MSSSPDAHDGKEPKKRGTKKRKKKGSSEPQRPVSAYALFFRDTQAAIKAENSSATFGEISKIVASMWDSLSEENKQVYKQKTENAKRDYLKHLAAFRANMISKGNSLDAEEEDSQPLSVLREKMVEQQRATTSSPIQQQANTGPIIDLTGGNESLPPPPKLQLAPGVQHIQQEGAQTMTNVTPVQHPSRPISPGAMLTKIIVPGQNGAQSTIHLINTVPNSEGTTVTTPPTPQTIQLRNIITHQNRSPITILPRQPGQIIKLVPSQEGGVTLASVNAESVKGRILKIDDIVRPLQTTSPGMSQASSSCSSLPPHQTLTTQEQTPILQLLAQESTVSIQRMDFTNTETPQTERSNLDGNELMQIPQQNLLPSGDLTSVKDTSPRASENQTIDAPRQCIRDGCTNIAVSNPYWDNEYCSNECVYSHCRDVFDAWVSTRQVTSSAV